VFGATLGNQFLHLFCIVNFFGTGFMGAQFKTWSRHEPVFWFGDAKGLLNSGVKS
jgi:hypothetical protein